jgi:transcriptional regulator with XRE-family HTH domain
MVSTHDWEVWLGEQIRGLRLANDIDQRELAARAQIALNAVKRVETGRGATIASLIKILVVLGKTAWLEMLNPEVSRVAWWDPKSRVPMRRRVSRRVKDDKKEGEGA